MVGDYIEGKKLTPFQEIIKNILYFRLVFLSCIMWFVLFYIIIFVSFFVHLFYDSVSFQAKRLMKTIVQKMLRFNVKIVEIRKLHGQISREKSYIEKRLESSIPFQYYLPTSIKITSFLNQSLKSNFPFCPLLWLFWWTIWIVWQAR